jgi:hypothetical protein
MKKLISIFIIIFYLYGCHNNEEKDFYNQLLISNLNNTPYTAYLKIKKVEINKDIKSDSGKCGYVILKIDAEVIETFKGDKFKNITYFQWCETPVELDNWINNENITSLEYSKKDNHYYVPDNGYSIPATNKLLKIARSCKKVNK